MENVIPERQDNSENQNRVGLMLLAPVVTANVIAVILIHWRGYDWLAKSLAVVLAANLISFPLMAIWGEKTGRKKYGRLTIAAWAYMCLLLATTLFAYRR